MLSIERSHSFGHRSVALCAAVLGLVLVISAGVLAPAAGAATALAPQDILARAAPSVGVVRGMVGNRTVIGTAFVIDREGWLVTASHVAHGTEGLQVDLPGTAPLEARVVGYDAPRDLALLRVAPSGPLPALELADRAPRVGDAVAVIGSPQGRAANLTTGEVVATGVSLPGLAPNILVRVSAAVGPGMSGGPLLNDRAQVVGMVIAASLDRSGIRTALAVSAETVQSALPRMRQGAKVERAWMGIVGNPSADARDRVGGSRLEGAVIRDVMPGSPAAAAGLRAGDLVVEFDGTVIRDWDDLLAAVGQRQPGERVRVVVVRDGRRVTVTLTLGVRP